MVQTNHPPPLREELRDLLELSSQPILVYGALLRRFRELDPSRVQECCSAPTTVELCDYIDDILPPLSSPYLDLNSRAALCHLLSQTSPEEEESLGVALLCHLMLRLEPYLLCAERDPDQFRQIQPLLKREELEKRPVQLFTDLKLGWQNLHRSPPTARKVADRGN